MSAITDALGMAGQVGGRMFGGKSMKKYGMMAGGAGLIAGAASAAHRRRQMGRSSGTTGLQPRSSGGMGVY